MVKIKIYITGKTKEVWLTRALSEYEQRLRPHMSIEWIEQKVLEPVLPYIALDPQGELVSSEGFANIVADRARLTFAIGGADGLLPHHKADAERLVSLSPLTFTHQMSRLILLEQLYRSIAINKGLPYHK